MTNNKLYCGQPAGQLRNILGLEPVSQPIDSWFWPAERYHFHKARIGIRHACDLMGLRPGDEVLAPAYYCGSEIDPLIKAGAKVTLYRVDAACRIDIEDLRKTDQCKNESRLRYAFLWLSPGYRNGTSDL